MGAVELAADEGRKLSGSSRIMPLIKPALTLVLTMERAGQ
jgi:hypothetical protein